MAIPCLMPEYSLSKTPAHNIRNTTRHMPFVNLRINKILAIVTIKPEMNIIPYAFLVMKCIIIFA